LLILVIRDILDKILTVGLHRFNMKLSNQNFNRCDYFLLECNWAGIVAGARGQGWLVLKTLEKTGFGCGVNHSGGW